MNEDTTWPQIQRILRRKPLPDPLFWYAAKHPAVPFEHIESELAIRDIHYANHPLSIMELFDHPKMDDEDYDVRWFDSFLSFAHVLEEKGFEYVSYRIMDGIQGTYMIRSMLSSLLSYSAGSNAASDESREKNRSAMVSCIRQEMFERPGRFYSYTEEQLGLLDKLGMASSPYDVSESESSLLAKTIYMEKSGQLFGVFSFLKSCIYVGGALYPVAGDIQLISNVTWDIVEKFDIARALKVVWETSLRSYPGEQWLEEMADFGVDPRKAG